MKTYMDDATCPAGHAFNIERRATSAGWITPTTCPVCKVQFDVRAGLLAGQTKPVRKLLERDIEQRLLQRVKQMGGEVRKVSWIGRKGAPDRLVMLPVPDEFKAYDLHKDTTIWVELKAPGKAAKFPSTAHERAQHREHERMRKMGQRVEVVDSYEQIEELFK